MAYGECCKCGEHGKMMEFVFWRHGPGRATQALLGLFCVQGDCHVDYKETIDANGNITS